MRYYFVKVSDTFKRQNLAVKRKALTPIKENLLLIKQGLAQESRETKVMLSTYKQFTKGKATKQEMEQANKQFVDVIRSLGLGVLVMLPFSPITLPFVVKLGERLGINVLPSAFMADPEQDNSDVNQTSAISVETEIIVTTKEQP